MGGIREVFAHAGVREVDNRWMGGTREVLAEVVGEVFRRCSGGGWAFSLH